MNEAFYTTINILQVVLFFLFIPAVIYVCIFAVAGVFYRDKKSGKATVNRKIAVLIPGYKEDEVIIDVANAALKQSYPTNSFDVIVIADSFQPATLEQLKKIPVLLIEVSFEKSTKSKALNSAMEQLDDTYDIAVILDADNIMDTDFLEKINNSFETEICAVQGHRAAKNLNTGLAVLDAVSEEINNHIFRKGHRVLGLGSAIIGSGMAFRYPYFKKMMAGVNAIGGFDKEIELKMLSEGLKIEYLNNAWIYDEKIQKADAFTNQRRRWLSAQFYYFKKDIGKATRSLLTQRNVDYFDKAIQFIQPPRILLLGATILFTVIFIVINYLSHNQTIYSLIWLAISLICVITILLSIPKAYYNKKTLVALSELPKGMILMIGSLLKIKGANKQFLHTKHGSTNN